MDMKMNNEMLIYTISVFLWGKKDEDGKSGFSAQIEGRKADISENLWKIYRKRYLQYAFKYIIMFL